MKRTILFLYVFLSLLFVNRSFSQINQNDPVIIGAEIFIEPGQNPDDVDEWFRILKENGM